MFVSIFRAEYIPQWMVEKRKDEFQNLRQGGMSIVQYVAELNRLSKYCRGRHRTEPEKAIHQKT
jgi:hypothetical protein